MFRVTQLIHLSEEAGEAGRVAFADALRAAAPAASRVHAAPTLSGVYNGGDVMAHHVFASKEAWAEAEAAFDALLSQKQVRHVDRVACAAPLVAGRSEKMGRGIYRALFLAVKPGVDQTRVEAFERELGQMPRYITAIRNWRLSRVEQAAGARAWTHLWEQEYESLEGLNGPYMLHPYHWARVDRWFDPECEDWIVDTHICHSFSDFDQHVI